MAQQFTENAAPSQVNPDMFHSIRNNSEVNEKAPSRNASEAFIRKMHHPPSAIAMYEGIPTPDARTQVCVQHTGFHIVNQSSVQLATPALVPVPSNYITGYAMLKASGVRMPCFSFVKYTDLATDITTWKADIGNTTPIGVYDFNRFYLDAQLYRPTFNSTTCYLNATSFNDTGVVAGYQFNPSILFAGTRLEFAEAHPVKFAKMVKCGIKDGTIKYSAEDIDIFNWVRFPKSATDQFEHYCGVIKNQAPKLDPDSLIQIFNSGASGNTISGNNVGALVPTTDQILNASVRSYGGRAKDGSFVVQRLNSVSPAWLSASNTNNANVGFDWGLYECWVYWEGPASGGDGGNFTSINEFRTGTVRPALDTLWSVDHTWSWVVYEGLSPNLALGPSPVAGPTLITKHYIGFEVQPAPMSPWAGLQKLGPEPDLIAIQELMKIQYTRKDVLPASANFWGALGQIVLKALPTVLTALGGSALKHNEETAKKPKKVEKKAAKKIVEEVEEVIERKPRRKPARARSAPPAPRTPRERTRAPAQPKPKRSRPPRRENVVPPSKHANRRAPPGIE